MIGQPGTGRTAGHRVSDWLALHGLDVPRCQSILARAAGFDLAGATTRRKARLMRLPNRLPADLAWKTAAQALARRHPELVAAVAQAQDTARTNFNPDEDRFPRAFALHDDGSGRPFVSCPYHETAGDLMAIAHEFGHVLQITASAGLPMPPALREVCAFIAELALLSFLEEGGPQTAELAKRVWQVDTRKQLTKDLSVLESALASNDTPYHYQWNYPVARILAIASDRQLDGAGVARLFAGELTMPELCDCVGL